MAENFLQAIIYTVFAGSCFLACIHLTRINIKKTLFYLSFSPFALFLSSDLILVFFIFVLSGLVLFILISSNKYQQFLSIFLFITILLLSFYYYPPPSVSSVINQPSFINSLNELTGEHKSYYPQVARLFHNKTELIRLGLVNTEKYLSLTAIFSVAPYPNLSDYYPLGFLFPWDLILIIWFLLSHKKKVASFFRKKFSFVKLILILFLILIPALDPGSKVAYLTVAPLIYVLLFGVAFIISTLPNKVAYPILVLNFSFIIYQLLIYHQFLFT